MWRPIPYLEVLALAATVAPAELLRVVTSFGVGEANQARLRRVASGGVPAAYWTVTVLALTVVWAVRAPVSLPFGTPSALVVAVVGLMVGVAVFGVEILVGAVPLAAAGERFRLRPNTGGEQPGYTYLVSIESVAVAEEVIYRGLWLGVLTGPLHVPVAVAVLASAAAYAAGHLFFGVTAVAQKFVTGTVFGVLMAVSGSLVAPIVAHLVFNALFFGFARGQRAAAL